MFAQDIAEELSTPVSAGTDDGEQFREYIKIIGNSKKIFIMTNNSASLNAGDFVTFLFDKKCTARALVAKNHKELVGVKIMKIYSLMQWARLKKGQGIQILKGDDTRFCNKKAVAKKSDPDGVKSSDEIFKESSVFKDQTGPDLTDYTARNLKTDHMLSGQLAMINSLGTTGEEARYFNWNVTYGYQFMDNIYAEGLLGQTNIAQFPSAGKKTDIINFEGRLKYNYKLPYFMFAMPYVGFMYKHVISPSAGKNSGGQSTNQLNGEITLIENMKGYNFVAGVTILRRLVPGWFVKADISLDMKSIGFAIEF